jgi:hypothetical protein
MQEKTTRFKRKYKEMGVISAVIVASQMATSMQNKNTLNSEFIAIKDEINKLRLERAELFATKRDIDNIGVKVDQVNAKVEALSIQGESLRTFLKTKLGYVAFNTCEFNQPRKAVYLLSVSP